MSPRAHVITVGDEILAGDLVDRNLATLGQRLRGLGISVVGATSVRDRVDEIASAVSAAAQQADVCVLSGGLGPTTDDLTTAAVARAAGVSVELDEAALAELEAKFARFGRPMAPSNKKQAQFPAGAESLPNPIGTARGFALTIGGCWVFSMPGVPRELTKMMREQVEPRLRDHLDVRPVPRRIYRSLGMGESSLAQRVEPVLAAARERSPGLAAMFVHYRASMPEVTLTLEATPGPDGSQATDEELASVDGPIREVLSPALYGIGEAELAPRLASALIAAGLRVGFAESCTAGGAAALLGSVAGVSASLDGGIVSYSNAIKAGVLGVSPSDLDTHGAVSEPVARAMAEGARRVLGSDLCVGITGIAGPDGGSPEKPVGTVDFAVSDESHTHYRRLRLLGNRGSVQRSAARWALKLLWDRLVERGQARIEIVDETTP